MTSVFCDMLLACGVRIYYLLWRGQGRRLSARCVVKREIILYHAGKGSIRNGSIINSGGVQVVWVK